jgi:hypothetical protein
MFTSPFTRIGLMIGWQEAILVAEALSPARGDVNIQVTQNRRLSRSK